MNPSFQEGPGLQDFESSPCDSNVSSELDSIGLTFIGLPLVCGDSPRFSFCISLCGDGCGRLNFVSPFGRKEIVTGLSMA